MLIKSHVCWECGNATELVGVAFCKAAGHNKYCIYLVYNTTAPYIYAQKQSLIWKPEIYSSKYLKAHQFVTDWLCDDLDIHHTTWFCYRFRFRFGFTCLPLLHSLHALVFIPLTFASLTDGFCSVISNFLLNDPSLFIAPNTKLPNHPILCQHLYFKRCQSRRRECRAIILIKNHPGFRRALSALIRRPIFSQLPNKYVKNLQNLIHFRRNTGYKSRNERTTKRLVAELLSWFTTPKNARCSHQIWQRAFHIP